MVILQINKFYWVKGGSERYYFDLTKLLASQGHTVVPFAMQHENNELSPYSQYFVSRIDFNNLSGLLAKFKGVLRILYSFEAKRKLEALLKEVKPDVAHLHNIAHQLSPSILSVLKKHNIPVVQTLHDYQLICPNAKLYSHGQVDESCRGWRYYHDVFNRSVKNSYLASTVNALELYLHKAMRIYEKNIQYFIAPSKFLMTECIKFGEPKNKFVHLNYSFNLDLYQPHYDAQEHQPYVIYYGRLAEEKGIDILLKAFTQVEPGLRLKIVGTGPEETKLNQLATKLKINDRVEFIGYQKGARLRQSVAKAQCVVVPSIWWDNSPLVIYESFALGKPVVASRMGGMPELVKDGVRGLLFSNRDSDELAAQINQLNRQPALRQKLGWAARQFVIKDLHPSQHYDKVMDLYQKAQQKKI